MKTILGKLGRKRTIIFWPENILLITGQSLGFPTEETRSELDLRFRSEIVDNFSNRKGGHHGRWYPSSSPLEETKRQDLHLQPGVWGKLLQGKNTYLRNVIRLSYALCFQPMVDYINKKEQQGIFWEKPEDKVHLPDPAETYMAKGTPRWPVLVH